MKKIKYFSLVIAALFGLLFILTSCGGAQLKTPQNVAVDVNNKLSWKSVSDARSYIINIDGVENEYHNEVALRKTSYSLNKLDEGDYLIKVKAIGTDESVYSEWTEEYAFHRDYESGCVYTLINNNTEYEVTKAGSANGVVLIEDVYRGKPVTRIGDAAFKGNGKIEEVVLGKNITYIGDNAFYNCSSLKKINLPDSITYLGQAAFQSCRSLESIAIPAKILDIPNYCFSYCRALKTITLPNGVKSIGESSFQDCSAITSFVVPETVEKIGDYALSATTALERIEINGSFDTIPASMFQKCTALKDVVINNTAIKEIGDYAFSECVNLENITLSEGLEKIGERAFNGCEKLASITIPTTVMKIGRYCFVGTKLYADAINRGDVLVYADNWVVGYNRDENNPLTTIVASTFKAGTVGLIDSLFSYNQNLSSVRLSSTIQYVGERAFYNCPGLYQFVSPKGNKLKYIWDYAFTNDEVLSNVSLNEGLEHIGKYAFAGCVLIESTISIPSTLNYIGTRAFQNTGIWENPDEYGVMYAGNWVVGAQNNVINVYLKDSVVGIANYAFYNCRELRSVIGLSSAKYIGYAAFYNCENLQNATLNKNIKKIEDYTFFNCHSLFNVSFPAALTEIGDHAFYQCNTLNEVDLSSTRVTKLAKSAFSSCSSIMKVSLPKKYLTEIGDQAFYKCYALQSIDIPDGVTYLGVRAFYKCTHLEEAKIGAGITTIFEQTFYDNSMLKEINISDSITTIEKSAFYKCSEVEKVTLGANLTNIGAYAFFNMPKVTELVIPESVKEIGSFAFKGWNGLSCVILSGDYSVGQHAFYGCLNASFYTNKAEKPEDWHKMFNSNYRPIVYGATLSSDNSYVVSITITENTFDNMKAKNGLGDPQREGYTFGGWSVTIVDGEGNSKTTVYSSNVLDQAPVGAVATAIWNKKE